HGMGLALVGLTIGLIASLALTRLMESLLFDVSASDPIVFGLIAILLAGVAFAACAIPALRATRVDPMIALRYELQFEGRSNKAAPNDLKLLEVLMILTKVNTPLFILILASWSSAGSLNIHSYFEQTSSTKSSSSSRSQHSVTSNDNEWHWKHSENG